MSDSTTTGNYWDMGKGQGKVDIYGYLSKSKPSEA